MSNLIELHNLEKVFDLTVSSGELTAIMGASGSGKSTLLNIVGCLDTATAGSYRLDGKRVDQLDEEELALLRRTKLGFVFQNFSLLHSSTALENTELPMVYLGLPRRERHRQARAALETVGLGDRMGHRPWQLSGGQQQRLALARALVNRPQLLLADEPTGNLDSKTSEEVLGLLVRLHREEKLTVLLVTHDADIAALMHRVIILHDGRVVYDEPGPAIGGPPIPHVKTLGGATPPPAADAAESGSSAREANS